MKKCNVALALCGVFVMSLSMIAGLSVVPEKMNDSVIIQVDKERVNVPMAKTDGAEDTTEQPVYSSNVVEEYSDETVILANGCELLVDAAVPLAGPDDMEEESDEVEEENEDDDEEVEEAK